MPVSEMASIPPIMREIQRIHPQKIIDLGVGFGKYGVLCRELLDATEGRVQKKDWTTWIEGVEGFEAYRNPAWDVYDKISIGDIKKCYEFITGYDLVLMVDSLEHMERSTADCVLEALVNQNRHVIVSVPLGNCPQDAVFGNDFECHRSIWNGPTDFGRFKYQAVNAGVCLVVSIFGALRWPNELVIPTPTL